MAGRLHRHGRSFSSSWPVVFIVMAGLEPAISAKKVRNGLAAHGS
jgi:hypothetical protein